MNFFNKLFSTGDNKKNESEATSSNLNNTKKTIFDFFQIDLKNIPDDSFIEGEVDENIIGENVHVFRKSLNYKECGLFDTIEVIVIGSEGKNVIFKSFEPKRIDFEALKRLIDDLYLILGSDGNNKGKFNSNDKAEYLDTEFYMLFGRNWSDFPKHKYPISIQRDENEVSITIWGIDN